MRTAQREAVKAARAVGAIMRGQLASAKRVLKTTQHDIKLELDVRCQKLIERRLHSAFPDIGLIGEEGVAGNPSAEHRWVVDPLDGTVNFAYGIPHACVSIALQSRVSERPERTPKAFGAVLRGSSASIAQRWSSALRPHSAPYPDGYQTLLGIVYDPFCDELWTAIEGGPARLNGKVIRVSRRRRLAEAIVCIGLSKTREHLEATLPFLNDLARRARKIRIMGAGALDLTYVASGRFDAYFERNIRLWDIAAGGLILECAGGEFSRQPIAGEHAYRMLASNGLLRHELRAHRQ